MQIGFVGLGKMGGNMVHRIHRDSDHQCVAFDFDVEKVAEAESHGASGAASLKELVEQLEAPRAVWVMVPAGDPTEATVKELAELLEPGDLIIDGGNSNFHDDIRRAGELMSRNLHYVDVGTSGGIWGLDVGYCMMVGGNDEGVALLKPILDVLAPAPAEGDDFGPGWRHFGAPGAGHYVKMVHNGVEYGIMQAYAEGFELMHGARFDIELQEVAALWNRGSVVRSWLCELAELAFAAEGNDLVDITGHVSDSGEGRWTIADGIDQDVPTPVITAALYARFYSRGHGDYTHKVLAALRGQFGGHAIERAAGGGVSRLAVDTEKEPQVEANPLVAGLERFPVPPTTLTIFGATGDLARRKLLPALYNLAHEGSLPDRFNLVGASRREQSDDEFRAEAKEAIESFSRRPPDETVLEGLLGRMSYLSIPFDEPEGYQRLAERLEELDQEHGAPLNKAHYLSVAPDYFPVIIEALKAAKLNFSREFDVRAIIEKPFGTDLESAEELQRVVSGAFREQQVFRIDHYLGKETVQNMLAFRFSNLMFEPVWNRSYIDHVQITASEDIGIGSRAGYYDASGALRDLVQNHMMQLVTLLCMEPPVSFDADKIRDEKVKVLHAIRPLTPEEVAQSTVRAQYTGGTVAGEEVSGYVDEADVPQDTRTETYAALRLEVENWRWAGVPIVLRTGKRLARKVTEIAVMFKPVPTAAFGGGDGSIGAQPNQIVLTMQPDEGVSISLGAKIPGTRMRIRPVNMEFHYGTSFMSQSPEAYERLIMDAMRGEATLFTRADEALAQWAIIDPVLKAWQDADDQHLRTYEAGSAGPAEAEELLLGHGRQWRGL